MQFPGNQLDKWRTTMRYLILTLAIVCQFQFFTRTATAHGSESHPKCKKGYVVSDNHKCVKAP